MVTLFAVVAALIARPDWAQKPTGDDLANAYPAAAFKAGIDGRATMDCHIATDGAMSDCQVIREDPQGQGFGEAVLKLAGGFKVRPLSLDGQTMAGRMVRIPIRFAAARPVPPGPTTAADIAACYGQTANAAEQDPGQRDIWRPPLYWKLQLQWAMAKTGATPSVVEGAATRARLAAAEGPPAASQAWDLQACLQATPHR